MARVVLGSYMVRYPLGGMMSWVLQYVVGFQELGHDIWFVEKAGYPESCFDPSRNVMTDDPSYGIETLVSLLSRFELQEKWCFVDVRDDHHGLTERQVGDLFRSADVFVDMGTHGSWLPEATATPIKVLIDGEPGFTQMKMEKRRLSGEELPAYDHYYTTGLNVGTARSSAPTAGKQWRHLVHPVSVGLFEHTPVPDDAPYTSVLNWQSYDRLEYDGQSFGHKDLQFEGFMSLPAMTNARMEVAVAGKDVPVDRLREMGWSIRDAHQVTASFDSFCRYIQASRAEFGVCKHGYVATNSGWFSDRSAAYLASGRPAVLEDTGFSDHLPTGEGLFAVRDADEAASAIEEIEGNLDLHAKRAREIAEDVLSTRVVLPRFLEEIDVPG